MASFLSNNPTNRDYLSGLNFKLLIKRAPNVNYFVQRVNIPGMQGDAIVVPAPLGATLWQFGNKLYYNDLEVTFKVNENFDNYMEITKWLVGLGHPLNLDQYAALAGEPQWTNLGVESTITLMILNAQRQANIEVVFPNCIPYYLSDLDFNTTDTEVQYLAATVKFKFSGPYEMSIVNAPVEITTATKVEA